MTGAGAVPLGTTPGGGGRGGPMAGAGSGVEVGFGAGIGLRPCPGSGSVAVRSRPPCPRSASSRSAPGPPHPYWPRPDHSRPGRGAGPSRGSTCVCVGWVPGPRRRTATRPPPARSRRACRRPRRGRTPLAPRVVRAAGARSPRSAPPNFRPMPPRLRPGLGPTRTDAWTRPWRAEQSRPRRGKRTAVTRRRARRLSNPAVGPRGWAARRAGRRRPRGWVTRRRRPTAGAGPRAVSVAGAKRARRRLPEAGQCPWPPHPAGRGETGASRRPPPPGPLAKASR